ncbi:MAG TPA: CpsB/CapC family capsule biosynthesis tyrosine phosphatase [Polyangiaceae bacterium]|nr:CpsB/CapC family capsule biosynthesis tyrosine phosphatase [Polyangiaceae bacterium]
MSGYVDLHCHWLPGIDDGVPSEAEGLELLRALGAAGFELVVATPHMRPGMFDNDRASIEASFGAMAPRVAAAPDLPAVGLAAEHFFDATIFERMLEGRALPYPGGYGVLVELSPERPPLRLADRFFDLRRKRLRPVLAHPERYAFVADDPRWLDPLLDGGTLLLLDVAALVGKYGRRAERTAHRLLEGGYYYAACSDSHRPADVDAVVRGIERLRRDAGDDEASFLLSEGPRHVLAGTVDV